MIVSCANCNSKYSVDDSKIKGKRFGFGCPKCGENIEIDNRVKIKEKEEIFEEDIFKEEKREKVSTSGLGKSALSAKQDAELPSEDELTAALGDLESEIEEENSLNLNDMELPDLEGLGEISEAGETADDINIPSGKPSAKRSPDKNFNKDEITNDLEDDFMDKLGEDDFAEKDDIGNLLDDFNPMEEDISGGKELNGDIIFTDELDKEENDDSGIINEVKSDEIFSHESKMDDEDESITIDLDSLDIQLEEDDENKAGEGRNAEEISETFEPSQAESLEIMDIEDDIKKKYGRQKQPAATTLEDEEDITLDLDSLDLTLDEVEELKEGEAMDMDDERISLSDAGLTPDELVKDKEVVSAADMDDEDIRLNIDEVAPEVGLGKALPKAQSKNLKLFDESELPEIDLDKFEEDDEDYSFAGKEEIKDIEDIRSSRDFKEHEAEIDSPDADIRDTVPGGMISFSIDYSLGFSRIGALFRLLCLYPVVLIPHFIVLLIYSLLSVFLSLFNWLIILFSGEHEEDFTEIQKNTIRYLLSLSACGVDVVEDMPKFAGRKDIDYALQYNVTYPVRYSRVLAVLRLTVVGIIIAALPHIILLIILSIGSMLICLIGIIMIIVRKRWPDILFDFMIKYYRYAANVLSFIVGVIDRYPSFKFE